MRSSSTTFLPMRRPAVVISTLALVCLNSVACSAWARSMRAFCLVLRAFGPFFNHSNSRRNSPACLRCVLSDDSSASAFFSK